MFHVSSSVTRLSPGATSASSMWDPCPGAALFQPESPSSLLGPAFILLPHACQDLQEKALSPQ